MNRLRFYAKLAFQNIKTNRKFYIPYILTGMGTSLMLYIMLFLRNNDGLAGSFGGRTVVVFLQFGYYIIMIFSAVVLFYTNSFLMKRRKNELGLYIILGMEKRHLGGVQFFESAFVGLVSILGGVAIGIGFSRLTLSLLTRMAHVNTPLRFSVDFTAVGATLAVFLIIYFVIFLYNLTVVGRAKPIELLKGSAVGEREPKTKWVLTVLGVLALGGAYAIAILTEDPMAAILMFFVAVILVIAGTYLLFTTGSITILKALRGRKSYYYKTSHFINVSGMIYRMKQNAVGLANICILSTMVLVMVSTTVALNVGVEDILNERYPGEIVIAYSAPAEGLLEKSEKTIRDFAEESGVTLTTLDHRLTTETYTVDGVEEIVEYLEIYMDLENPDSAKAQDFASALLERVFTGGDSDGEADYRYSTYRTRGDEAENVYSMYGGFLFLGISLGVMFLMAAILIIYYKQITEGYSDRERFIIMQKVGLSSQEIKSSIRSQILTVFFLPLLVAVVHVGFAFSIITKLLAVLYLTDVALYAVCTAGTIAVFALIYLAVYLLTAREYYKIVTP